MITEHVSRPTWLIFGEFEGGGWGGENPSRTPDPNVDRQAATFYTAKHGAHIFAEDSYKHVRELFRELHFVQPLANKPASVL